MADFLLSLKRKKPKWKSSEDETESDSSNKKTIYSKMIEDDMESSSDNDKIMKQPAVSHKWRRHIKHAEVLVSDNITPDEEELKVDRIVASKIETLVK